MLVHSTGSQGESVLPDGRLKDYLLRLAEAAKEKYCS